MRRQRRVLDRGAWEYREERETSDWIDKYVNDMERGERLVDVEESMQELEKQLLTVGPAGVAVQFAKPM